MEAMELECPICQEKLAESAQKYWLVEEAEDTPDAEVTLNPQPVCRSCAKQMVGKPGALGRKVIGFKRGVNKPESGGLILRS